MRKLFILFFTAFSITVVAQPSLQPASKNFDDPLCVVNMINTDSSSIIYDSTDAPYALIAGGSKGIGYGIAEALAKRKYNLILIARHYDSLETAKIKLESMYHIHVEILIYDLSKDESAEAIAKWCTDRNIRLKMLCNVAGIGGSKDFLSLPLDSLRYMVRLNVESAMALSLTMLPLLEKNSPSYILNVASMAGLAPIPIKNMYSATKSAVVFFSYSLRYQLKKKHISVSVLCPGPVYTKPEIIEDTKKKMGWFGEQMALLPKRVGEVAIRKTLHKRLLVVPGTLAKVTSSFLIRLPRRLVVAIYSKLGNS
ncbi:MAG TPA: SDR family NAD(P)-dependent oxidoreductase [Ferruginibacter sp.]|jgi:short-subunit dehydrogenase|nr:SDR family NAD(P)-dependent oxidoreductase [Ferruginibacter sp.]